MLYVLLNVCKGCRLQNVKFKCIYVITRPLNRLLGSPRSSNHIKLISESRIGTMH